MDVKLILGVLGTINQLAQTIAPVVAQVREAANSADRETIDRELEKLRAAVDLQHALTQSKLRGNTADEAPS